jgi:hypothetical protein
MERGGGNQPVGDLQPILLLDGERETLLKLVKEHPAISERERKIIILRFGLEDGHERTLREIGNAFKVTRERIRQIEAKALRKLRRPAEPSNSISVEVSRSSSVWFRHLMLVKTGCQAHLLWG